MEPTIVSIPQKSVKVFLASGVVKRFNVKGFDDLQDKLQNVCKIDIDDEKNQYFWLDSENDWVSFSTEVEWSEAMSSSEGNMIKIQVTDANTPTPRPWWKKGGNESRIEGGKALVSKKRMNDGESKKLSRKEKDSDKVISREKQKKERVKRERERKKKMKMIEKKKEKAVSDPSKIKSSVDDKVYKELKAEAIRVSQKLRRWKKEQYQRKISYGKKEEELEVKLEKIEKRLNKKRPANDKLSEEVREKLIASREKLEDVIMNLQDKFKPKNELYNEKIKNLEKKLGSYKMKLKKRKKAYLMKELKEKNEKNQISETSVKKNMNVDPKKISEKMKVSDDEEEDKCFGNKDTPESPVQPIIAVNPLLVVDNENKEANEDSIDDLIQFDEKKENSKSEESSGNENEKEGLL